MFGFHENCLITKGLKDSQREKFGIMFYECCLSIGIDCGEQAMIPEFKNIRKAEYINKVLMDIFISEKCVGVFEISFDETMKSEPEWIDCFLHKELVEQFKTPYVNELLINHFKKAEFTYASGRVSKCIKFTTHPESLYRNDVSFDLDQETNKVITVMDVNKNKKIEADFIDWPEVYFDPNNAFLYLAYRHDASLFNELLPEFKGVYNAKKYSYKTHFDNLSRIGLLETTFI